MNENYLIPANAKRGKLIFGYFRGIDLAIFATGITITFILGLVFQDKFSDIWFAVGCLIPAAIATFLVLPIPNQHNMLVLLGAIYAFYFVNRQKYFWKGWCGSYGDEKDKK